MTDTLGVGSRYVVDDTAIVDLGCSRGEALAPFVDRFGVRNRFLGLEVSEPMLAAARERWGPSWAGVVDIRSHDLRTDRLPPLPTSLVLSVFTLQFVPIEYRQTIVNDVYARLRSGGAFLLAEKVLGSDGPMQTMLVDEYHALKHRNGYSLDDIERKRRALENRLVPITAEWNERLLSSAGFASVECVWRRLNFAAWVAVKR